MEYASVVGEVIRSRVPNPFALIAKIALCRARHGFGPRDFFDFQLQTRPLANWGDYISDAPHMRRVLRALHPTSLRVIADDKVLCTERLMRCGVTVAPVIAVAGRTEAHPSSGDIAIVNDAATLAARLDHPSTPASLFCKPAMGTFGRGVLRADRHAGGWQVGTQALTTAALAERILRSDDPAGTLVMPTLFNHPGLAPIAAGEGLSATRIYTALTTSGVEIFCTLQKVMTVEGLADNFGDGAAGHLLCTIDPESGRFTGAYGRLPGERFLLRRIERHAMTGAVFSDFVLPCWAETLALARRAAEALHELPLPGLDLALTPDGPVVLEANAYCYAIAPQLQHGGARPLLEALIPRLAIDAKRRDDALWALRTGKHPRKVPV